MRREFAGVAVVSCVVYAKEFKANLFSQVHEQITLVKGT